MRRQWTLPYPPSANRYWRVWRGRPVMSTEARRYKQGVGLQLDGEQPLTGPVGVSIEVHRPARRGDLDNSLKVALDALRGLAFNDDRQVVKLIAHQCQVDRTHPRLVVEVWSEADPEDGA